jgi:hypothetical protein
MVNFKRLTDKAKDVVEKRGGTGSLKEDAAELQNIAKGKGSLKDKAKAAGKAVKDPGARGPEHAGHQGQRKQPPGARSGKQSPGARPEADEPGTRSK